MKELAASKYDVENLELSKMLDNLDLHMRLNKLAMS